jgi:hypothetical protein
MRNTYKGGDLMLNQSDGGKVTSTSVRTISSMRKSSTKTATKKKGCGCGKKSSSNK